MQVLRKGNNWEVNKGNLQANGLYNASNGDKLTNWFSLTTEEVLNVLKMSKKQIDEFCEEKFAQSN
jgi:hypothetical protein